MARSLPTYIVSDFTSGSAWIIFLVKIQFDSGDLNMWSGYGNLTYSSETYIGTGHLMSISDIEETEVTKATGVSLTLSGVPSARVSEALSEPYQGRTVKIWIASYSEPAFVLEEGGDYLLDEDGNKIVAEALGRVVSDPYLLFQGFADQMDIQYGEETSVISMSCENKLLRLERPIIRRYTDQDQKLFYPNDRGLEFVQELQDKVVIWRDR